MTDVIRQRRARFAIYCKLTCLGGSEQAMCPCRSPRDCEMQDEPGFVEARAEAAARMRRHFNADLRAMIDEKVETIIVDSVSEEPDS
jgi:hypothetical protein